MKIIQALTIKGFLLMLSLNFFKINGENRSNPNSAILGMILLEENEPVRLDSIIAELKNKWKLNIVSIETKNETSILQINGYNVVISYMPVPVPGEEIKHTAQYNYFWENATNEAVKHKGHIILSIMNTGKNHIKENILFNQVASTILHNSKSIGIYIGGRNLLLKKDFYLENIEKMSEDDLPLFTWIYFGLRTENGKHSIYTYGLKDFNKKEMEIINSDRTFSELIGTMFDLSHYVISSDVTLRDGETIGSTPEQKLKITESKGKYLEEQTLKIEY